MISTNIKKRKYVEENRQFQKEWIESFAFIDNHGSSLCLICKASISNYKVGNLRRHYEGTHAQFSIQYPSNSKLRTDKLCLLQSNLYKERQLLSSFSHEDDKAYEASFLIAWNIARAKRPYAEGEFIKKIWKK